MKFKSLLILPLLVASLQAASVSDLTFSLNGDGTEYSVTDCSESASGDLEIPSTYQDFPVTTVADEAFKDCTSLTSITIPDSVTTIGEKSFFNTGITSIVVPDSVTSIGYAAFQNCSSLTTVTLPDALTKLEAFTFVDWTFSGSLTSINIPSNIEEIGDSAIPIAFEIPDSVTNYGPGNGGGFGFFGDPTVIFSSGLGYRLSSSGDNAYIVELEGQPNFIGPGTGTTLSGDIVIPQTIDGAAVQSVTFSGWVSNGNNSAPGITGITVSEGIVSIAEAAFLGFEDLVNINLPDSLTIIDWNAFSGCTSLTSITIPKNVSKIGGYVFNGASNLNEIIVDPDNAHYISVDNSLYDISLQTLVRCRADATDFIVPDTVTTIGNGAFAGCSNLTSVTIPNSVTSIRSSAFADCTGLTSITIPGSVTSIDTSTFYNCTGLTSITIPDSVTSIEEEAFADCTGLTSITIPDSVTSIEEGAFFGCSNLASITIGAGLNSLEWWISSFALENAPTINISSENPYLTVIDGVVFNQAKDTLLGLLFTNTDGSYTIPYGVTSIGDRAFQNSNLTSITIPDSVTSIGNGAFQNCYSLTGITIPGSVTSIGQNAFSDNYNLTSIIFNGTAPTVETNSFSNIASNPKAFVLDYNYSSFSGNGNLSWNGLQIFEGLSFSQNSDNTYTLHNSDTTITGHLVIPSTYQGSPVTIIDNQAFQGSGLTSITIPEGVTTIRQYAFRDCYSLTSVFIPDSVVTIDNEAFRYCYQMRELRIGSGLQSDTWYSAFNYIGENTRITFYGQLSDLPSYHNITLSTSSSTADSNRVIRDLFSEIYIVDDYISSIPDSRFYNYSNLTKITIPDGVTSIGHSAFGTCSSLTSITIPDSVTSIGQGAFSGCTSLTSITIPSSVTTIGSNAFASCTSLASVSLSEGLVSIKGSAFNNCDQLETISIPSTVRDIGKDAFDDSEELREITFEGPPPAFSVRDLQLYGITPTMYYKVSPQAWMVYQSSYGLPLVYLGPPTIQVQPQDVIASIGDSIMLSVEARDVRETALSYQWMCNGIEIAGKTAANLSIVSLAQSDVGNYQVKVTNAEGTTVTEGASVTIADGGISNGLYTQQQYDAALTSGFNLGVQSVGGSSDSGGSPGTPAATSAILDVYYSTDLTSWDLMESIEVENPPEGQLFMKTELTPPSE